jgi:hypothetical protein
MIFNFIGPPCAGKSYIASKYALEHPDIGYQSIDNLRIQFGDETTAWMAFEHTNHLLVGDWVYPPLKALIMESSGLSWRLPAILKRWECPIYTIAFLAKKEVLHKRLEERQYKRKIPYKLRMDEKQSIDWVLQNIGSCEYPIDLIIRTDEISQEELYSLVSEKIAEIRLLRAMEKKNVI